MLDDLFHSHLIEGNGNAVKFQHSVKRRKFSYAFLYIKEISQVCVSVLVTVSCYDRHAII